MSKLSGKALTQMLNYSGMRDLNEFQDSAVISKQETELLFTTDFGPLVGKNCADAGTIAALNASGGIPVCALVILIAGEDIDSDEREILLSSIIDTCRKENVKVAGGHTIAGEESVVGLSVIGNAGQRVFRKRNCRTGDVLLLNKKIGTGIALRGYYYGVLGEEFYQECIHEMKKTNRLPDDLLSSRYIHSMTDITGFGLLGHLSEMLGGGQGARLFLDQIPYVNSISGLSADAYANGFIQNNLNYARERHNIRCHLDTINKLALCDPQTNGPILLSAAPEILNEIEKYGLYHVGTVISNNEIIICGE